MIIRLPKRPFVNGDRFPYLLMSDLHVGAADCEKDLIRDDLKWAKKHGARVFIAGDVFDLLLPKDHKRYNPSRLDRELQGKDAVFNTALDLGSKLLKPYADLIDMIGCGNHETAITKFHSADITSLLVERLSTAKHKVVHGGYTGAIIQSFRHKSGNGCQWTVWYHHGIGGAAAVTRGMIDFNRFASYVRNADLLWCGHKHYRWVSNARELRIPERGGEMYSKDVLHCMTGAYTGDGIEQIDEEGNYLTDWSREKGFAPAGRGGIRLWVTPFRSRANNRIWVPRMEAVV